jgi:hypothetical protein
MTVESIKQAIAELGAEEKTSLATWLIEQDAAEWDRQMAWRGRNGVDGGGRV